MPLCSGEEIRLIFDYSISHRSDYSQYPRTNRLDSLPQVDLFSPGILIIDDGRSEFEVLPGVDGTTYRFKIKIIMATYSKELRTRFKGFLKDRGYVLAL